MELEPKIIVLMGLSLTGKTTVALELAKKINHSQTLDVDSARMQLFGQTGWLGPEREREIMAESYRLNHHLAMEAVKKGQVAILSGVYSRKAERQNLLETICSKEQNIALKVFWLYITHREALERMSERIKRGNKSNVLSPKAYWEQVGHFEPVTEFDFIRVNAAHRKRFNAQGLRDLIILNLQKNEREIY